MAGIRWKGKGYCKALSVDKYNEYHNIKINGKMNYCSYCRCDVIRCNSRWSISDINGNRCSNHKKKITRDLWTTY